MSYRKWTDQELIEAVKNSKTKTEVLRNLKLDSRNSGNFQTINAYIIKLNIDTSHFIKKASKSIFRTRELSEILIKNSDYLHSNNLKERLIKENILIKKCYNSVCNITSTWNNKSINLHLDHINGIHDDNRLENLRLLCPNCHSQTDTYCRGIRRKKDWNCLTCGVNTSKKYQYCRKCSNINKRKKYKILWPPIEEIIRLVSKLGYSATGKLLKVTDNSVRKYIKQNTDNKTFLSLRKRKPRQKNICQNQ